jgi:hypothetical protein
MSVLTTMELLTGARRILRSQTRTPGYWSAADRLTQLWTGIPLRASPEFPRAAGADLGSALDWLYDEGVAAGESAAEVLVGLTRRFQEMATLETATREVSRLRETGLGQGAGIEEAVCATIALLTTEGTAALTRRGSPELTARWQRAWADFMWRQNLQQQRICGLGLLPRLAPEARRRCMETLALSPEDLRPRATSFSEGVEEFLHAYGETSAGSVALLGSLPFSTLPLEEVEGLLALCTGPSGLLPLMARLLRFAPDVSFDPAEALNTGVFATAAEQRRSLLDVMGEGGLSKPDLDARLRGEWERYASRLRGELDAHLSTQGGGAGTATAATIVQELFQLLDLLVPGTWKQG